MEIGRTENTLNQYKANVEKAQENNLVRDTDNNGVLATQKNPDAIGLVTASLKAPVDDFATTAQKTRVAMEEALEKLAEADKAQVQMHVNGQTGQLIARIVSLEDGRLIREIPPEQIMEHYAGLSTRKGGLLNRKI